MSRRREKAKAQNTINKQLEPAEEEEDVRNKDTFYLKASDIVFDLAKLVFGGGMVGGWFEEVDDKELFYVVCTSVFVILLLLGYVLFRIGNNKKYKSR